MLNILYKRRLFMDGTFWSKIAISSVILGLSMLVFNMFSTAPDLSKMLLPPVHASATAQELLDTVVLSRFEIAVKEQGHLARAAFAIDNSSVHDIKNIEILCTLFDAAGEEQGRDKWVIYDTIKAQTNGIFSTTLNRYVTRKASSSQCQIVDMKKITSPLIAIHRGDATGSGGHQNTGNDMHGDARH